MGNVLARLPTGVDSFSNLIRGKGSFPYYYVDKSMLIRELTESGSLVNLITRPRRFGKSLNLSMIHEFYSNSSNPALFDGLEISRDRSFCRGFQNKSPVLHLDFKDVKWANFDLACLSLAGAIRKEARRFDFLQDSDILNSSDKHEYEKIVNIIDYRDDVNYFVFQLSEAPYTLCYLLAKHFGRKAVVLIDEYDTPLNHAYSVSKDLYDGMSDLIGNMFSKLLKNNEDLELGVLTGCLRISKESIFTGMNNFTVWDRNNSFSREYFGFTEDEVRAALNYYDIPDAIHIMRDWYEGFCFGSEHVYCPWDAMKYIDSLLKNKNTNPQNYWGNTSSNEILSMLLKQASDQDERDFVSVMSGKPIEKKIKEHFSYKDLNSSNDAIWSVMVASGYLTVTGESNGISVLEATNREVRSLLQDSLYALIKSKYRVDDRTVRKFNQAFPDRDPDTIQSCLNIILGNMLTIRDESKNAAKNESLYHGILLGILSNDWLVHSEIQTGDGYLDISFFTSPSDAITIEVKYATGKDLERACDRALKQIREKRYDEELLRQGATAVLHYGIAFQDRKCCVKLECDPEHA